MARGRPKKSERRRRSEMVHFRLDPSFHSQLKLAAKRAASSLSQEIETRLRKSFELEELDKKWLENFGGPETYAFLRTIADAIKRLELHARFEGAETGRRWFDDPRLHAATSRAVALLLEQIRPAGDTPESSALDPRGIVAGLLDSIALADDEPAIDGAIDDDGRRNFFAESYRLHPRLKKGLGPLVTRFRPQAVWDAIPPASRKHR